MAVSLAALSVPSVCSTCGSDSWSRGSVRGSSAGTGSVGRNLRKCKLFAVRSMAPEDEKMTRRSPLDFPVEWDRPSPGRRPDIFPQFSPMKTPMPPPLPADPPEEDEEEEEKKEEEEPEKEPEKQE